MSQTKLSARDGVAHLRPEVWDHVNRALVAKAIGEFAHELLIEPRRTRNLGAWDVYVLGTDEEDVEYEFRAQVLLVDHWYVDARSLRKRARGVGAPIDALAFVAELRRHLGIPTHVLPGYLEEVSSTLFAAAYKHVHQSQSARELVDADFQQIEAGMAEGHPVFVANNGRVGFDACDYPAYAPEAAAPIRLVWLAAHERFVDQACVDGVEYSALLEGELGLATLRRFWQELRDRGLDPEVYRLIPVHPWQWQNRVAQQFAADLAAGDLVYVGESEDVYQAQQSIRTLFNLSHPTRHYVKTALSILNMGFTRGLKADIGGRLTAVNDWVAGVVAEDAFLRERGFGVLREVAFVGYRHRHFERIRELRHQDHQQRLGALWRESPVSFLAPGERLMTMSALLHRDREGASLLAELIAASGLEIDVWVRGYLRVYLQPLLHCFYAHDLAFTPHCENVILVLRDHAPVRVFMKDIGQDAGIINPGYVPPESVRHQVLRVPEEIVTLSIFTDVFDGVLRFVSCALHRHAEHPESVFWGLVAESILEYQAAHPEQAAKHARYDLFASSFLRNCLNRLQLLDNEEMVNLSSFDSEVGSLQLHGELTNPVAGFRPVQLAPGPGADSRAAGRG